MALLFNGSSTYLDCGSSFTVVDNMFTAGGEAVGATVMAWIYPRNWGSDYSQASIIDKSSSGSPWWSGWHFGLNDFLLTETLVFTFEFNSGHGKWRAPSSSISLNTWQHVAVSYNNASTANNPKLYINGVSVTVTETSTPSGTPYLDQSYNLVIGGLTSNYFYGDVADLRCYKGILSDHAIQTIYASIGNDGIVNNLRIRYLMKELATGVAATGAGTIKNLSGYSNNANPVNSPVYSDDIISTGRMI